MITDYIPFKKGLSKFSSGNLVKSLFLSNPTSSINFGAHFTQCKSHLLATNKNIQKILKEKNKHKTETSILHAQPHLHICTYNSSSRFFVLYILYHNALMQ